MDTPRKKKSPKAASPTPADAPAEVTSEAAPELATEAKLPASIAARVAERAKAASAPTTSTRKVHLKIQRQDEPDKADSRRYETFEVAVPKGFTVHEALASIRERPVTVDGKRVAPPVWEASCVEESCGACTMLVDGRVRHACSTRIDEVSPKAKTIVLEPLSKFRVLRDLVVDRSRLFETFAAVSSWVSVDPLFGDPPLRDHPPHDRATAGAIPEAAREGSDQRALRLSLAECIGCGACLEACPEFGTRSAFVGAAAINQARLMNLHPTGQLEKRTRLESLMGQGGITDCGKAQNCVEVCPKSIPLVESIAAVSRDTTKQMIFGWILG